MGQFTIDTATSGNQSSVVTDVTIDTWTTDAATGQKETEWINTNWSEYFGIYNTVPEMKASIDALALWSVGKGYTTDELTKVKLQHIKGCGIDTFDTILRNLIVCKRIGGDAFAEIIQDNPGNLINLKPLDPSVMKIVANSSGIIVRYEQMSKVKGGASKKFTPEQIFHLAQNRVADQIHGISSIQAIKDIILASNESFADNKELQHRYVRPRFMVELDTEVQTKIDAFITKFDETTKKGENIFYPKGAVKVDLLAVPSNATLNPLPWRQHIRDYFWQSNSVPQIVVGSSGEFNESTAKVALLSFSQVIMSEQKYIESQLWNQMQIKLKFVKPATLQNELMSDTAKDGQMQAIGIGEQPNELTAGAGE